MCKNDLQMQWFVDLNNKPEELELLFIIKLIEFN